MLVRSPCNISEPYNKPFWDFSNGGKSEKKINKNRKIPTKKIFGDPLYPLHYHIFGGPRGVFSKVVLGFRNFAWAPKSQK